MMQTANQAVDNSFRFNKTRIAQALAFGLGTIATTPAFSAGLDSCVGASTSISSAATDSCVLGMGESVTLTAAGSIVTVGNAVQVTGSAGSIVNNGTITSTGAHAIFVGLSGASLAGGITNTGTINGDVHLGNSVLNLDQGSVMVGDVVRSAFQYGGTVNVNSDFTTGGTFDVDNLNIASGGTMIMAHDIAVRDGFGILRELNNAGVLQVNAGTTATITGHYVQASTGQYRTTVSSDTSYGKLLITGDADISASNQIFVNVTNGAALTNGIVLTDVLKTNGALTYGGGGLVIDDNSVDYDFTAEVDGTSINLTVTQQAGISDIVLNAFGGSNFGATSTLLYLLRNSPGGDLGAALATFRALQGIAAQSRAVQQLLPPITAGMSEVTKNVRYGTNRVVQARQDSNKGLSSGDEFLGDKHVWFKPVGSWADQDDRNGVSGYSAKTFGGVLGADGEISDKASIGVAFSYMHSNVDANSAAAPSSASIKGYQGVVYGSYSLDDRTELSWQADIGLNKNKTSRNIVFAGVTASGDYDSWTGHVGVGVSRRYDYDDKVSITPGIRVDYTRIHDESYTESGAPGLNLAVNGSNADELILMADVRAGYAISDKSTLTANLGVGYDVLSERSSVTSAFVGGGPAFTTEGLDPSPVMVRGGAGLVVTNSGALEITARYDFEVREDFDNQTASVKFRMPF